MKSETLNSAYEFEKFSPDNFSFAAFFFVRTEMFFRVALLGTRIYSTLASSRKNHPHSGRPIHFSWLLSLTSKQIIW